MKVDDFLKAYPHRSILDAVTLADVKTLESDQSPADAAAAAKAARVAELRAQLAKEEA